MKLWLTALLLGAASVAAANPPVRTVDLDRPGAVAALENSNPAHFARLRELLAESTREAAAVERFVRTAGGTAVRRGDMIRTSYPAKAALWFTLDDTQYVLTVTVPDPVGRPK